MAQSDTWLDSADIKRVGTFDVIQAGAGFGIQDTDTFNDWGRAWGYCFSTALGAAKWAAACHDFKVGHRMTMPDPAECGVLVREG